MNQIDASGLDVPPYSLVAEQELLAGLMTFDDAWIVVAGKVKAADFYEQRHGVIFDVIEALANDSRPRDAVSVAEKLKDNRELDLVGGLMYLSTITKDLCAPSVDAIGSRVETVRNKAFNRELIKISAVIRDIGMKSGSTDEDRQAAVEAVESSVYELTTQSGAADQSMSKLTAVIKSRLEQYESAAGSVDENGKPVLFGKSTGIDALDERWGGLRGGSLYYIGGRPKMGKTTAALNIAENVAVGDPDELVAVFSMEMDDAELADKFITSAGRVDFGNIRNPSKLGDDDWPRISAGVKRLSKTNVFIDETSTVSCSMIRSNLRRLVHKHKKPLSLVVVDYIQLMHDDSKNHGNRENEISAISRGLKRLAKDFDVPVIAMTQLNRKCEERVNKRPMLSDMRESGSLEQDANVITFVYRDDYYNEDSQDAGTAEFITAAQRGGPIGTDRLSWLGKHQKFEDFQPTAYGDYPEAQQGGKW